MKDVTEASFNAVISESRIQFIVPLWQRLYSWETDQWKDLWEDLLYLYAKLQEGKSAKHFLGSVVVKTIEEKVGEITRRILIDGQQRVTTLLLICALIRDRARDDGNVNLVNEIESDFLFNIHAKKLGDKPKLRPTEADRKIFDLLVGGSTSGKSGLDGSQLSRAYKFFERRLNDGHDLEKLLDCVRALRLVTIRLEEGDNPNRIFETLNFRGKELDQADLVRNYFMMAIKDENKAAEIYYDVWFPMQQSLGTRTLERIENLEDFLRHYIVMINQEVVKKDRIYSEMRRRLKYSSEDQIILELKSISAYSKYYGRLLFANRESDSDIRRGIERLNRLKVGVHYPFLLKIYKGFSGGEISKEDFCLILETIESFVVRRFFQRLPTNSFNRLFAELCKLPYADAATSLRDELAARSEYSARYWPSDDKFENQFRAIPIYRISPERCRFVLETLEEDFKHPERVELSNLWIEHVMPDTLDEKWKGYLGSNWENVHETYLHTIGNLTLVAPEPNRDILKNKLFSEKKTDWYSKSKLSLTLEINNNWNEWTENEIQERASILAQRALKIWQRP